MIHQRERTGFPSGPTDGACQHVQGTDPVLTLTEKVIDGIVRTVGMFPCEQGGVLGGAIGSNVIDAYLFESGPLASGATYRPCVRTLNLILTSSWVPRGTCFMGFVHSHPPYLPEPSSGDLIYAARILEHMPRLPFLALPIVISAADAPECKIMSFVAIRTSQGVQIKKARIEVVSRSSLRS